MPQQNKRDDYELRDEYDFSKMNIVAKGRYAPERRAGKNVVLLAPDVAQRFRPMMPSTGVAPRLADRRGSDQVEAHAAGS